MSDQDVRKLLERYVEVLLDRGDYAQFFAEDVEFAIVGTDQHVRGRAATEQAIRFFHETAFDANPEIVNVVVGEGEAAAEAVFVGTHVGEFAGIAPTGRRVRLPYSAFYDVRDGRIAALRLYMSITELVSQVEGGAEATAATSAG
jgi:steroid delta-isomerase-like uncharacterized protein